MAIGAVGFWITGLWIFVVVGVAGGGMVIAIRPPAIPVVWLRRKDGIPPLVSSSLHPRLDGGSICRRGRRAPVNSIPGLMSDTRPSIRHLEQILALAKDLADDGIGLYRYEYRPRSFGSFVAEFGTCHERVLCEWDGRESVLSVSYRRTKDQAIAAEWTHDANISVSGGDVFAEIGSQVLALISS